MSVVQLDIAFGTKPYDGTGDSKLPAHIKKLSLAKRRRWVSTFNSVLKDSGDEGKAFRIANSVIKKD